MKSITKAKIKRAFVFGLLNSFKQAHQWLDSRFARVLRCRFGKRDKLSILADSEDIKTLRISEAWGKEANLKVIVMQSHSDGNYRLVEFFTKTNKKTHGIMRTCKEHIRPDYDYDVWCWLAPVNADSDVLTILAFSNLKEEFDKMVPIVKALW